RALHAVRDLVGELIGDAEQQRDQRFLISGIDLEHVEADTLRRRRIIEQTITLRLLQRGGNAFASDRLEMHRGSDNWSGDDAGRITRCQNQSLAHLEMLEVSTLEDRGLELMLVAQSVGQVPSKPRHQMVPTADLGGEPHRIAMFPVVALVMDGYVDSEVAGMIEQ